ncbi:hypothetical protein M9980_13890 [Sphingomonas donggukensis]|uniref:Uncharacterized protein n=1 Tax=Sphingomonas donggukensis TaxID=2949093 RepID=A0ABY4TUF6_9SPHN|nr:hypothetical protein [Sphingomonas donggukensis]URW75594.1 hypothetical protein M9980_13890 [Sphingomonas donggukensis]
MEKHYRAVHGQQLPRITSELIAQGIELLPAIARGLERSKKQTGKSRDTVESVLEIDALPIFHCVAASIASLLTVDERSGVGMGQVIDQIARKKPVDWSLSCVSDNDCVHALFLAHRIAVIQDRHTPPPSFIKYAKQQRQLDAQCSSWSPPFNYAQVRKGLTDVEKGRPLRDAHFEVEGRKVRRSATANPRDPENARRLLEMRSRFWFRLHL